VQVAASDVLLLVSVLVLAAAAAFPWRGVGLVPRLVLGGLAALLLALEIVALLVPSMALPGAVLLSPLIAAALAAGVLALAMRDGFRSALPARTRPSHAFTLAQASDPATPAALLRDIAFAAPELRAAVRANPSVYPDLAAWIDDEGKRP
jgi:hypothetical protein